MGGVAVDGGPNPYGRIPYICFPNLRVPGEFWGESDLVDLLRLQRELNTRLSIFSRILEVAGNPVAVVTGADAEDTDSLRLGPNQLWTLPEGAKAEVLDLLKAGGANAHLQYIDLIYRTMHDISEMPRTSFGDSSGQSTARSGVALEIELQPLLHKLARKRAILSRALERRAQLMLAIARLHGVQAAARRRARHLAARAPAGPRRPRRPGGHARRRGHPPADHGDDPAERPRSGRPAGRGGPPGRAAARRRARARRPRRGRRAAGAGAARGEQRRNERMSQAYRLSELVALLRPVLMDSVAPYQWPDAALQQAIQEATAQHSFLFPRERRLAYDVTAGLTAIAIYPVDTAPSVLSDPPAGLETGDDAGPAGGGQAQLISVQRVELPPGTPLPEDGGQTTDPAASGSTTYTQGYRWRDGFLYFRNPASGDEVGSLKLIVELLQTYSQPDAAGSYKWDGPVHDLPLLLALAQRAAYQQLATWQARDLVDTSKANVPAILAGLETEITRAIRIRARRAVRSRTLEI